MGAIPAGMVAVGCEGVVKIRTPEGPMPVFMFFDEQERQLAVPLSLLESKLLEHSLESDERTGPQPHRAFLALLKKMYVTLDVVYIRHDAEYEMPTSLVLIPLGGEAFEMDVPVGDGIIYGRISGAPILIDEALMSEIGARPNETLHGEHPVSM
jgi:bifunctional DNase/RNase